MPKHVPAPGLEKTNLGDLYAESGQTLESSFSAVSKPNFATKYALEWKALAEIYTMHSFALLSFVAL